MNNYQQYFSRVTYKPTYYMGDRVRGFYQGVPFVGTVDLDTMIDPDAGPYVVVNLDLPIKIQDKIITLISVKHKDLFNVKGIFNSNRKTHSKKSTVGSDQRSKQSR